MKQCCVFLCLGFYALEASAAALDIGHKEITFTQLGEGPCHGQFGEILHACGGADGCDAHETVPYKECANSKECAGFMYGHIKNSADDQQVKYWLMKAIDYSGGPVITNEYRFKGIDGPNCFVKSTNIVIKKNHEDWGIPMTNMPTPAPTHMPIVSWENPTKQGGGKTISAKNTKGQPTAKPTAVPTAMEDHVTCRNGDSNVPGGWVGAGEGSNYCNLCRCMPRGLYCTMRKCDLPLPSRREDREVCKHISCKYDFRQNRVKVQHHHAEPFQNVHCAYDRHNDKCQCMCHDKFKSYAHTQSMGYKFEVKDKLNTECRVVTFAKAFDSKYETNVVLTTVGGNEASQPLTWVERSWSRGFKMCATAQGTRFLSSFEVNVYAFQSTNTDGYGREPFVGSRAGDAEVVVDWGPSDSRCGTVKFSTPFIQPSTPHIVGTVNLNSLKRYQGDALVSWIDEATSEGFKVCFSQARHSSLAKKDYTVHFTYLAVQQAAPVTDSIRRKQPYLEASTIKSNGFYSGIFTTCKDIPFPFRYDFKPTIIVSAVVPSGSEYDSSYSKSVPVHTYVKASTSSQFTVCSSVVDARRAELQASYGEDWYRSTKLGWNYILLPRSGKEYPRTDTSL